MREKIAGGVRLIGDVIGGLLLVPAGILMFTVRRIFDESEKLSQAIGGKRPERSDLDAGERDRAQIGDIK